MITERQFQILRHLRIYKISTVALIRADVNPADKDGAVTRADMRHLAAAGLARSCKAQVVDPLVNSTAPIWAPTERGCCLLATKLEDMSLLLDAQPNTRDWSKFGHWTAVTALLLKLRKALSAQEAIQMTALHFEHDILNAQETEPEKKFRLYTNITALNEGKAKKIGFAPDFAFELQAGKKRRCYYGEYETGTEESPARWAARKCQGMHYFATQQLYLRHFPEVHGMAALAFCPNRTWLQAARRAMKDQPGAALWRFAAIDMLTPENFLTGELFYTCTEGPVPFVRPPAAAPANSPVAEKVEGR